MATRYVCFVKLGVDLVVMCTYIYRFVVLLEDWSSSSSSSSDSDDSEIEDILFDDDVEHMIMAHIVDAFEAGAKRLRPC